MLEACRIKRTQNQSCRLVELFNLENSTPGIDATPQSLPVRVIYSGKLVILWRRTFIKG